MMIEIKDFQKIIDRHTTLDIPLLMVESGEVVAVVGSTGSGIDTLFDLLTGKLRPSAGSVRLASVEPADKVGFSCKVGVLFAEDSLYKRQSPKSNLILQCQLYGLPKSRALEVLEQIGMADQAEASLEKLSSSLSRRLAFGRSILHRPVVLLLCEPFARCDEPTITLFGRLIRRMAAEGVAILILTSDALRLETLCDRIYHLQQGHLILSAASEEETHSSFQIKIPVRAEDKVILVNPGEILYIEAKGGHTCLKTPEARLTTQFTLNELEERLSRSGFFRAHRSYLVNLQHIKEIIPYTRNSFSLRLDDPAGTEIPLSKTAAGELKDLFGY
jgi:ABC-2 type transport system ATP-binding protein